MDHEKRQDGGYAYHSADALHTGDYLSAPILAMCRRFGAAWVLDLGCGNGAFCGQLAAAGYRVVGCDPSEDGIRWARQAVPGANFARLGVDDDPAGLGERDFDVVVSTEVVEHLPVPANLPRFAWTVLKPGGHLIVSTPYHGYLKNLLLSLLDKWDEHQSPFWVGGHIKFWSRKTLARLLEEQGFQVVQFLGVGRWPYLWKSMILVAVRPVG